MCEDNFDGPEGMDENDCMDSELAFPELAGEEDVRDALQAQSDAAEADAMEKALRRRGWR